MISRPPISPCWRSLGAVSSLGRLASDRSESAKRRGRDMIMVYVQSLQSILAMAFCATGALAIAIGSRQITRYDISNIPIISPRAKHAIGILLVLIGALIFLSQFI